MFIFDFHWQIQHFLNQFWWQINFLLLIILVAVAYLAYKKPAYAVGLTIILLPTYLFRSQIWFLPFTFLELCIWATFLGWLVNSKFKIQNSKLYEYRLAIFLILAASTISMLISPDLRAAAGLWKAYFIEPIVFFVVIKNVLSEKNNQEIILWSLGVSTLTISVLAIYQKFTGFGIFEPGWVVADHRRVTSFFSSPNAIGLLVGPTIALYLGWLVSDIKNVKKSILKFLMLAPAMAAVIFSVSQGTWLGLMAAVIFLAFFGWNKKWTAGIVGSLIILTFLIPAVRNVAVPIITLQDVSGQNRIELWNTASQELTKDFKNFTLGPGMLGFKKIQSETRDPLKIEALLYPHNIILNFWTEVGLLGLIAFSLVVTRFFKQGFKKIKTNKWLALGIMSAMLTVIVHGLIDVPYFKNDLAVLFWIIVSLI